MDGMATSRPSAFACWLRTGSWPVDAIERKFNPYHDPRDGRFTFAPGGPRSLERVVVAQRRRSAAKLANDGGTVPRFDAVQADNRGTLAPAVLRADRGDAQLQLAGAAGRPPGTRPGRGDNGGPPPVPMTLEQAFPGLANTPAGGVLAVMDQAFDIFGPAARLNADLHNRRLEQLRARILGIDPVYPIPQLSWGKAVTASAQANEIRQMLGHLNRASFTHAARIFKATGDYRPLQVQTRQFLQDATDAAYDVALANLRNGKLRPVPTPSVALGNAIDRQVRRVLRRRFAELGIDAAGSGPVRVNRRENISNEGTYRRPDARVGRIAFDVTLALKTGRTGQVKGFFAADFKPIYVVIIRPSQLDVGSSYIILRKEAE